jgi:RNA polymerase sigma factor (sigma-70 family)
MADFRSISPSGAPYPQKSRLDQGVGSVAQGVGNFLKGIQQPEAFPEQHRGTGASSDSWAGRTGGRLRAPLELGAAMAGAGGARSAPMDRLARLAKGGDKNALRELMELVRRVSLRVGQKARGGTSRTSPTVDAEDVAQNAVITATSALEKWSPESGVPFDAIVHSNARTMRAMARRQAATTPRAAYTKEHARLFQLEEEWAKLKGPVRSRADEVRRDVWIAGHLGPKTGDPKSARELGMDQLKSLRAEIGRAPGAPTEKFEGLDKTFQRSAETSGGGEAFQRLAIKEELGATAKGMDAFRASLNEHQRRLMDLKEAGKTDSEIATALGVSRVAVTRMAGRLQKRLEDMSKEQGFAGRSPDAPRLIKKTPPPIGGGSDAPDPWGTKPTRTRPLTPRETLTNPRALGTSKRGTPPQIPTQTPLQKQELQIRQAMQQAEHQVANNVDDMKALRNRMAGLEMRTQQDKRELAATPPPSAPPQQEGLFRRLIRAISGGSDDAPDDWYKSELSNLGMRYDGATEFNGQKMHWYTDPKTGSSGLVRTPQELNDLKTGAIEASRAKFGRTPPPIGGGSSGLPNQSGFAPGVRDRLQHEAGTMKGNPTPRGGPGQTIPMTRSDKVREQLPGHTEWPDTSDVNNPRMHNAAQTPAGRSYLDSKIPDLIQYIYQTTRNRSLN